MARQPYRELAEFADRAVYGDAAAVLLGHDVVADRQAETGAFARWLGGEEWLEQFVPDVGRNADAIVTDADLHRVTQVAGCDLSVGSKPASAALSCRFLVA